jgi:hypothetical protein
VGEGWFRSVTAMAAENRDVFFEDTATDTGVTGDVTVAV